MKHRELKNLYLISHRTEHHWFPFQNLTALVLQHKTGSSQLLTIAYSFAHSLLNKIVPFLYVTTYYLTVLHTF